MPMFLLLICFTALELLCRGGEPQPFQFRNTERIALIGDTLIEREQAYGELEERLTIQFPEKKLTVRNLGWSADTPSGISRASFDFDKPGKSFDLLKEQIAEVSPTLVIFGYGMASSFDGKAGLEKFRSEFNVLLDAIQKDSTNEVRFIFLSPVRHEENGPANAGIYAGEVATHNESLKAYAEAIRQLAAKRHVPFISLMQLAQAKTPSGRANITENGIHLSRVGYELAAETLATGLGWDNGPRITVDLNEKQASRGDAQVLETSKGRTVFRATTPRLGKTLLQVQGLRRGEYRLRIDGEDCEDVSAAHLRNGIAIERGPAAEQMEQLRQAILRKSKLCFERYRPQNETYLFGFRKHEQGQNAKEIPMFDPLIADQEARIEALRQPQAHTYELVRAVDAAPALHSEISMQRRHDESSPAPLRADSAPEFAEKPTFDLAPGVQINLFAQSPLLAKPTQMNFDPQGRLWVASSSVYPQVLPGQQANDKIIVLEDTNNDGHAEKSTVFADGLLIPTAVIPGDGGAYVGQSTELLHFTDTNGDGKADKKQIVLSAFGTEDTHHMVHTLRWGPDGQLYFNQSIYIHTHIETPHGVRRLNSGGVWRFRPDTLDLSVFVRGFCNPWGHAFDDYGQSFETDGAGGQGITYCLPGATFFTYASMRRELPSISPGSYPKFCGLELIRSPAFPKDWQGNAITCDFRAHRIVRFGIEEQGAGYAAHEIADVLRTTNVTFRPIDVKLGPDGALYVADWSNPIIQHGEVDFRDPRRDHEHGRIWRITFKDCPTRRSPELTTLKNEQLFDLIAGKSFAENGINAFNQQQARRVLIERGNKAVAKDLEAWTKRQTDDDTLLQAVWLYQSLNLPNSALLERLLHAKDGRIRAAAVRVLADRHKKIPAAEQLLAQAVNDEHPRVRLEALRALAEIPTAKSAALALGALDKPMDSFLDYALWLTINDLAEPWIASVKDGTWSPEGKEKQLEFALKAIEPGLATEVLSQVMAKTEIPADGSGPWIELIGSAGSADLLQKLYDQVLARKFSEEASLHALAALDKATRERGIRPSGRLAQVRTLLTPNEQKNPKQLQAAIRLAGAWKVSTATKDLSRIAEISGDPIRSAVLDGLRQIGGPKAIAALERLSAEPRLGREATVRLAALDLEKATPFASALVTNNLSESQASEFWRGWLAVKNSGQTLAKALPKTGLPPVVAKAGLRLAREGGRSEPELVWALTRGAGLEDESQTLSAAELSELAAKAVKEGNAARGEKLFRSKDLSCLTCHAIGGVGGKVGPDLTSIGASAQPDYLVESVLYPNRKIKEGYHAVGVETKDGMEYTGVLASENQQQLVLRDATGKETSIPKKEIENRTTGGSLMPSGLVDALQPADRLDLFKFLSELGKPGPYDASKLTVARAWKILVQTLDLAQFGDEKVLKIDLADKQWVKEGTLVNGTLLKDDFIRPFEELRWREPRAIYVASRFEVPKSEPITLKFEGPKTWAGWVDGKPVQSGAAVKVELPAGRHTFVARLDAAQFPDSVRLASGDVTFLNE